MTSLVSTDEVVARCASAGALDSDALQGIIDANEILVRTHDTGSADTSASVTIRLRGYPASVLLLPERVASVESVIEHWTFADPVSDVTLDDDDWTLAPRGTAIERREDGTNPQLGFADEIVVTYTPFNVEALRKNVLIQLSCLDVNVTASTGISRQRLGDYEEEHGGAPGASGAGGIADQKEAILAQLTPSLPVFS